MKPAALFPYSLYMLDLPKLSYPNVSYRQIASSCSPLLSSPGPISGTVQDWALSATEVTYAFIPELRSGGQTGFEPPPEEIEPSSGEFFDGVVAYCQAILDYGRP